MATKRRRFTAEFKAKVVMEALRGDRTIQAIAAKHEIHPNQISTWKRQAQTGLRELFADGRSRRQKEHDATIHDLHAKIEELTVERDFLARGPRALSRVERRAMIDREHDRLSISRQCQLIGLNRSTLYYRAVGESADTLALMRRIDGLYLEYPFYGSRQMVRHLAREGKRVGRHRVRRLMRLLGLQAIYRKPRTSVANPDHRVYPYLLRGLTIERPNQVWCADLTYIPVQGGFLYLVAIMDWASRRVLAWRLSNTMDTEFCLAALADALEGYGIPEIFNTDQGSQFTSIAFTGQLEATGIQCSMDGRGRWLDNVFIERLWRSLKYEAVYLRDLEDGFEAQRVIDAWMAFYNETRPHSALGGRTPAEAYRDGVAEAEQEVA
ncbi:MAG: IS3 family transposase [Spirochaetaceae bacterium]|nr:IS3 family transposase [Spirochaetaceae bacterium]